MGISTGIIPHTSKWQAYDVKLLVEYKYIVSVQDGVRRQL